MIIISSNGNFDLGLGMPKVLKPGRNTLSDEEYEIVKNKWFFISLVKSGAIHVEADPVISEIEVPPEKILEVEISEKKIEVVELEKREENQVPAPSSEEEKKEVEEKIEVSSSKMKMKKFQLKGNG